MVDHGHGQQDIFYITGCWSHIFQRLSMFWRWYHRLHHTAPHPLSEVDDGVQHWSSNGADYWHTSWHHSLCSLYWGCHWSLHHDTLEHMIVWSGEQRILLNNRSWCSVNSWCTLYYNILYKVRFQRLNLPLTTVDWMIQARTLLLASILLILSDNKHQISILIGFKIQGILDETIPKDKNILFNDAS